MSAEVPLCEPTIAYIAGILDARAHIELVIRRDKPSPRLKVTTRRLDLLHWLARHTGTTVQDDNRPYQRRACAEHCHEDHIHSVRQSAYWGVDGARAAVVLDACLPYFVDRRLEAFRALAQGVTNWQPRTELTEQMRRLGWPIPTTLNAFRSHG